MLETVDRIGKDAVNVKKIGLSGFFNFLGIKDLDLGNKQVVVRSGARTHLCIDGTGIIYRLEKKETDSMVLARVDGTRYMGYNFNAVKFSHRDTLFSFGGNGFWRYNGALTFFDTGKKEWEILKLNREVPLNSEFIHLDGTEGMLYFIHVPFKESIAGKEHEEYGVYRLDIAKREIAKMGDVQKGSSFDFRTSIPMFSSEFLNGLVIQSQKDYLLLDFKENKILRLTNPNIINFINGSTQNMVYYEFCAKDTLFNVYADGIVEKRKVSRSDFTSLNESLYKDRYLIPYLLPTVLLIPLLFLFLRKRNLPPFERQDGHADHLDFTPMQWDIVRMMLDNKRKSRLTKSEDITHAMGLQKKSLDVQKKLRTEIIHRINHNFRIATNSENDLVIRIKSEEDRRYIEYDISSQGVEWLDGIREGKPPSQV